MCVGLLQAVRKIARLADGQQASRGSGNDDADLAEHAKRQHRRHDIAEPGQAERGPQVAIGDQQALVQIDGLLRNHRRRRPAFPGRR